MRKKITHITSLLILGLYLAPMPLAGGEIVAHGNQSTVVVFVRSMEFQDSDNDEWVSAISQPLPLVLWDENIKDIGGCQVAASVRPGSYKKVRLTFSRWACMKGKVFHRGRWFFSSDLALASDDESTFDAALIRVNTSADFSENGDTSFIHDIQFNVYGNNSFTLNFEYTLVHALRLVRFSEDAYQFSVDISDCAISFDNKTS